jgi:outer membrane murein-binding lipoprotein Lpp
MMIALHTSHRIRPVSYATLVVVSLVWIAGCATRKAELKQEIEVLLQQTKDEVRQETNRMDVEIARLREEVGQLHSAVGTVDSKVGRMGSEVGQVRSDVALLQIDMRKNDTSMVDLAMRINQIDRRVVRSEKPLVPDGEPASRLGETRGRSNAPQMAADALPAAPAEPANHLKHGMSQPEVLRMFGNPHGKERILDSVYWYYAEGELKGQYVRFDATTGYVNGWSTFSPKLFQIDLRTTQGGPTR